MSESNRPSSYENENSSSRQNRPRPGEQYCPLHCSARVGCPSYFSGGNGTQLSFSLAAPVGYTITEASVGQALFVFQNTGNLDFASLIFGSIAFSINSGPLLTLVAANSGRILSGVVTHNDLLMQYMFPLALNIGDVVTLTAGTLTTLNNVAAAAPASGSYTAFIVDGGGNQISTNGTSGSAPVPETFSTLWLALPFAMMLVGRRRLRLVG